MKERAVLTPELFRKLLDWYEENKRVLPWREDADPYHVWISEIMLQQTRVETVKAYYLRWMERFPTVSALAAAEEDEVLKAWEGLGYYSRARNLHKAAKIIENAYGGKLPADKALLRGLPGVGEYTAGAILSIAFGIGEPAVDGNVLRVISRLTADPSDVSKGEVRAALADALRPLMPKGETSAFTQALFELGALICLPKDAFRCELCPLVEDCRAYKEGRQGDFPVKPEKAAPRAEARTVLLLECEGKYLVRKRPSKGLLANLYEFPNAEGKLSEGDVCAFLSDLAGEEISPRKVESLPEATHVFTHLVWNMTGYLVRLSSPKAASLFGADAVFASPREIKETYSLPSAFSAYKKFAR
ncbi:MAG: A/G-specific adenine glycosylase [Clostridia bacterium]|nr:A/G-specific adenine glycosylase [Clostridia bacterium]